MDRRGNGFGNRGVCGGGGVRDIEDVMASAKRYSPKQKEIAKNEQKVLFVWEMDKRYVAGPNDQFVIQCCGAMSADRARRIWAIIQEKDNQ
jgi:hypothetical protein